MKTWWPRLAAGVLVLLTVGCAGSDTSSNDLSASVGSDTDTESTEASAPPSSTTPASDEGSDGEPKSLDEYLGAAANLVRGPGGGAGGGTFDQDQVLEEQRLVQQEIQICMQAQGFTYVPEQVGDGLGFLLASTQSPLSPMEYAETEGLGISTRFDALLEGDVELTTTTSANDEHLQTLSDGEADAWQFALRGAPPERNEQGQLIDPETGEVIQGRTRGATGGCSRDAQETVRGDFAALADLADDFEELEERIAADPRIAEIARGWTDCMREAGFDFQDEAEARQEINAEFGPLLRSLFSRENAGGDQAQGQNPGQGQGGGNRLQAIVGLELTAEQDAALNTLQDRERAIAVASVQCQGDTDTEVAEITATYEAEFVEANRSALEAISG